MKTLIVLAAMLCAPFLDAQQAPPTPQTWTMGDVMDAIEQVESGGEADPDNAVGDGGRALGCLQIHASYFSDAQEYNDNHDNFWTLTGLHHTDVHDHDTGRKVFDAYMHRYAWNYWGAGMTEAKIRYVARIHNGGPNGNSNPNTIAYADKVVNALP